MVKEIPLQSRKYPGLVALVDDDDYELVSKFKWCPHREPRVNYPDAFYVRRVLWPAHSTLTLHKFLMPDVRLIDHIDGDGLNCQRSNLRPATKSQNAVNTDRKKAGRTSQFRGVGWDRTRGYWRCCMRIDGRVRHLGRFDTEEDAARCFDKHARELHGEFARLNFPIEEEAIPA